MRILFLLFTLTLFLFSKSITPDLEYQKISSVGYAWKHVDFSNNYSDAIVVCSNVLPSSSNNEAVVRVNNITSTGFDVKIQRPNDIDPGYTTDVYCIISDEGSYTAPVKYEAHKVLSNGTNGNTSPNNWSAGKAEDVSSSIVNSYTKPAVLGQVMSYNDSDFSVFWSFDCENRKNRPFQDGMADGMCVGKHVGQVAEERAEETLGYIVAETGIYELEDFSMAINYGADSIKGVGNSPAYTYTLDKAYTDGVITKEAEDGGQGGWAVLYGATPFGTSLDLAIDEETVAGDTTRGHITENVAYWVFLNDPVVPAEMKINEVLYRQTVNGTSNDEFIEFYVTASGDLKNYLVSDQDGASHHYRFPKHSVSVGDYVVFHIGSGTNSVDGKVHHFYQGSNEILNNTGDEVLLLKPSNTDVTVVDGKPINGVPFDYVVYTNAGDTVPTSVNGVSVAWNSAYEAELDTNTAGLSISLSPNGVDGDTASCWELTASGNASDNGCTGYIITRDTNSDAALTYSMGEINTLVPDIKLEKRSETIYDPINLSSSPKAIPGAVKKYVIALRNEGLGTTDNDSIHLRDTIPSNMKICVSTVGQCQEANLVDGTVSSGLSLGSITYYQDGTVYTPTADAEGYDTSVTELEFNLNGEFAASDGTNHPSATIELYMGVE